MGIIVDQLVAMGFEGYRGWNDREAEADFNATGGAGKTGGGGGGSSTSGASLPPFSFDQAAAEKQAMEELRPYYEKLLKIYNGDVNLAKKRMEEDYARGLRYKKESTATGLADIESVRAERDRKFKLALNDLDQEMNARGLTTSGIKTTEIGKATADEAYQKSLLDKQARDLATSEKQYIEGADIDRQRFLEEKGFAPVTNVEGYYSEPQKKAYELADQYQKDVGTKVTNAFNKAATYHNVASTPIATATPQNYTEVLNNSLKMMGLPSMS